MNNGQAFGESWILWPGEKMDEPVGKWHPRHLPLATDELKLRAGKMNRRGDVVDEPSGKWQPLDTCH